MLIGELASKTGFSRDTIRYYETLGLIRPDFRRESRYREYSDTAVSTLRFIRNVKNLGFTLSEIKEMIERLTTLLIPARWRRLSPLQRLGRLIKRLKN